MFVARVDNKIIGYSTAPQPDMTPPILEEVADDDAELLVFISSIPVISFDDFEGRFTPNEWDTSTDYVYEVDTTTGKPKRRALVQGLARAQARNSVDLADPKTDAFLGLLVNGGVLTPTRKAEILVP